MSTTVAVHPSASVGSRLAGAATRPLQIRLWTGALVLLGIFLSFMGLAWDIQWHDDVGPDTFFTLPHLVLYSGVALAGLTCLAVVLYSSSTYHAGRSVWPVETLTPVLWQSFWAPSGYIIGGCGSAFFLLFGLYDEWWHTLYGFDVTIFSPPHVGLLFSVVINMIGCIAIFAGARDVNGQRLPIGAVIGLTLTIAILLGILTVFIDLVGLFPFLTDPHQTGMAFAFVLGLLLVAAVVRRPGAMTLLALFYTGLRISIWYLAPWATTLYAAALGLYLRDYATGYADVAASMPAFTLLAALTVDVLLYVARWQTWPVRRSVLLAGGIAGLLLILPFQYYPAAFPPLSPLTPLWAAGLGAYFAWIGWLLGALLRNTKL